MKNLLKAAIAVALLFSVLSCDRHMDSVAPALTNDDIILQAWCWSFDSIRENLKDIADAGYTIVQTPPAQHCITAADDDEGGNQLFGHGRWYYHYQPTAWEIGNYQVGTREDLIELCDEAGKYGIRIIVDVLPNHTSIDESQVEPEMIAAVGGPDKLYHANGRVDITDYNDRFQCTTGRMGGLPDVNTENPAFQVYFMNYVNGLLACGVRGFRYDTAKHIGLPSDPVDAAATVNDFWDVATGRKSVDGVSLSVPVDELFLYGEVLQDRNVKEEEYAEYMGLTASAMGACLRRDLDTQSWTSSDVVGFSHKADPLQLVTWVESHDTYCNDHESAHFSDEQLRVAWVYLVARQFGTPLFYSRPDGSDGPAGDFWGNNIVGVKGNDAFKHPAVAAANRFRAAMSGLSETVTFASEGAVAQIVRGGRGAAVLNITDRIQALQAPTDLRDGTYRDDLSGEVFKVRKGIITGTLAPYGTYILM